MSRWTHEHRFDSGNAAAERSTRVVMWITAAMMVVEIAAGWWFNSMALLADGWHMSSHAVAIGLSAAAYALARRHAQDPRFAFGTWKIEILGGFASAIFLLGVLLPIALLAMAIQAEGGDAVSFTGPQVGIVTDNVHTKARIVRVGDERIRKALSEGKVVGWFSGRMEFGPRALGNRSILASPLDPYSSENLNVYIKHHEPFRKFAASVPAELASHYFETGPNARNLATVGRVRKEHEATFAEATLGRDLIRVHTVDAHENPLFHRLLLEAGKGNLSEADLLARLQPGSGIPPGPSLPGNGLFLIAVEY